MPLLEWRAIVSLELCQRGKYSTLKGFFANADRAGGNYPTGNIESLVVDIDPIDMSESMQEALHHSNLEVR
nr:hypothetical protein [Tanacetum cinerariifolium]